MVARAAAEEAEPVLHANDVDFAAIQKLRGALVARDVLFGDFKQHLGP